MSSTGDLYRFQDDFLRSPRTSLYSGHDHSPGVSLGWSSLARWHEGKCQALFCSSLVCGSGESRQHVTGDALKLLSLILSSQAQDKEGDACLLKDS